MVKKKLYCKRRYNKILLYNRTMPNYCSAFGCTNSSTKESCRKKGISFHKFPLTDKILLRRWLVRIRRANFQPTPFSYICSDHFTPESFEYQPFTNRRGLKKGAVPTKFSFNSYKSRRRMKDTSYKNQNHEKYREDASEPALVGSDTETNRIQMENPALLEVFMNEKFYPPEQLEALCVANGLPKPLKPKQRSSHALDETIFALKETLHAKILLRSLKKQLLDAEIKAANAKRDYYEAKKAMLSQIYDAEDSEDSSDSESELPLQNIKTRLEEEELATQIEEKMLQKQLKEVQMHAALYEKEYYEAKSSMISSS